MSDTTPPEVIAIKPSIADLEKLMDQYGSDRLELAQEGQVLLHPEPRGSTEPSVPSYHIVVGDKYASIYWAGSHWTHHKHSAWVFHDRNEAKAKMKELRESSSSTIRTTHHSTEKA